MSKTGRSMRKLNPKTTLNLDQKYSDRCRTV